MKPRRPAASVSVSATLALALLATAPPAAAHEVRHAVAAADVVVVRLDYADGKPFAFEAYEVRADGATASFQVGRTDAAGRALFAADGRRSVRLRAFAADGHGVDALVAVPPPAVAGAPAAAAAATAVSPPDAGPNRASRLLFGAGLLLAGFGAWQLRTRRRWSPPAAASDFPSAKEPR